MRKLFASLSAVVLVAAMTFVFVPTAGAAFDIYFCSPPQLGQAAAALANTPASVPNNNSRLAQCIYNT